MLNEVRDGKKLTKNKIVVGTLDDNVISFLSNRGIAVHTREIYLTSKSLSHLARESKKRRGAGISDVDILNIPKILMSPSIIKIDKRKEKLNLIYCISKECKSVIKVVVDTKFIWRGDKLSVVKTAGYVTIDNISGDKNYEDVV